MYLGGWFYAKKTLWIWFLWSIWARKQWLRPMICCRRRKLISCPVWRARNMKRWFTCCQNLIILFWHTITCPQMCALHRTTRFENSSEACLCKGTAGCLQLLRAPNYSKALVIVGSQTGQKSQQCIFTSGASGLKAISSVDLHPAI